MDETFINISDSAYPKFVIVTGSNNKAEANIAGITPAVLIFKGRWEDLTTIHLISNLSFRIVN